MLFIKEIEDAIVKKEINNDRSKQPKEVNRPFEK